MAGDFDPTGIREVERKLHFIARQRYRIPRQEADDLIQATIHTFLEVRNRYPRPEEHAPIIVGIFRNKCREHIERAVRGTRRLDELKREIQAGTADLPTIRAAREGEGGIIEDLIRREEAERILRALALLRPEAREMFRLITEFGFSRKQLIEHFGLNPATLDSRLHSYRNELKKELQRLRADRPGRPLETYFGEGRKLHLPRNGLVTVPDDTRPRPPTGAAAAQPKRTKRTPVKRATRRTSTGKDGV